MSLHIGFICKPLLPNPPLPPLRIVVLGNCRNRSYPVALLFVLFETCWLRAPAKALEGYFPQIPTRTSDLCIACPQSYEYHISGKLIPSNCYIGVRMSHYWLEENGSWVFAHMWLKRDAGALSSSRAVSWSCLMLNLMWEIHERIANDALCNAMGPHSKDNLTKLQECQGVGPLAPYHFRPGLIRS